MNPGRLAKMGAAFLLGVGTAPPLAADAPNNPDKAQGGTMKPVAERVTPAKLDFAWAEKRWKDPASGAEVVRLSPPNKKHYRHGYFRINEMTWDGRYIVFSESTEIKDGRPGGEVRVVARDLVTGRVLDLGPAPLAPDGAFEPTAHLAVARYSHRVNLIDTGKPEAMAVIQIDIDTGKRRRIELSEKLSHIYEASFDASERYIYTPWWKEKAALEKTMALMDYRAMMAAQPGKQDMARIDLETGRTEAIFSTDRWWMGHPNPHPTLPELFMCCQEWYGEQSGSKWGSCREHQRIRVIDLAAGKWVHEKHPELPWNGSSHEHWAPTGKRIYSHAGANICRIDLDQGYSTWYSSPPGKGETWHVMVAPNERFLVGDGVEFDRNMPAEFRKKIEALDPSAAIGFARMSLSFANGGETIWLYRLPKTGTALDVSPLCKRRTLCRTKMFGQRLESNAHVTPDSRWAVFVSSSVDEWFEVWAARVPAVLAD